MVSDSHHKTNAPINQLAALGAALVEEYSAGITGEGDNDWVVNKYQFTVNRY